MCSSSASVSSSERPIEAVSGLGKLAEVAEAEATAGAAEELRVVVFELARL